MILGINAWNISGGGGITHLTEILKVIDLRDHGFTQVVVWAGKRTLDRIAERDWLCKVHEPLLDCSLPYRIYWQRFKLSKLAAKAKCDVLFVPAGSDASGFRPMVTMSRNMLPFEWRELSRYGFSLATIRLLLVRYAHVHEFPKADGVIFLTSYSCEVALKVINKPCRKITIIPHGINQRFSQPPRQQKPVQAFSEGFPCRVLYVSRIEQYKHQWHVAEAIAQLRTLGFSIVLDLVGPLGSGADRLKATLRRVDPEGQFISYSGEVPYEELHALYGAADINVFASSCENMPNILIEGMAAGLPIACSNRGPMPEVLGDAGVYFDPESPDDIATAIRSLIESVALRKEKAEAAFERAQQYSWSRCAQETMAFLADIAQDNKIHS